MFDPRTATQSAIKSYQLMRLSAADAQVASALFDGRRQGYLSIADKALRLSPTTNGIATPDTLAFAVRAGNAPLWIDIPNMLLSAVLGDSVHRAISGHYPEVIRAMLVERAAESLIAYLEQQLRATIELRGLETAEAFGRRFAARARHPQHGPYISLSIDVELRGYPQPAPLRLVCPASWIRILQRAMPLVEAADPPPSLVNLPIRFAVVAAQSRVTRRELRELAVGDVVLADIQLVERQQVGVLAGNTRLCATASEATITLNDMEYPVMSDNNDGVAVTPDDVPVDLSFQLGAVEVPFNELVNMVPGRVFNLGADLSSPVEIRANGRMVGRGALVDIGGRVGVRVNSVA